MPNPTSDDIKKAAEDLCEDWQLTSSIYQIARAYLALRKQVETVALPLLRRARRNHTYCEDSWFSCPKSDGGCANDDKGDECDCGADAWNAKLDSAIKAIEEGQG